MGASGWGSELLREVCESVIMVAKHRRACGAVSEPDGRDPRCAADSDSSQPCVRGLLGVRVNADTGPQRGADQGKILGMWSLLVSSPFSLPRDLSMHH